VSAASYDLVDLEVFWDVMMCHKVSAFCHVTGPWCLYCEGFRCSGPCHLKAKALQSFEMTGTTNPPTWRHIPEDMNAVNTALRT
jgi:hypothetical protein